LAGSIEGWFSGARPATAWWPPPNTHACGSERVAFRHRSRHDIWIAYCQERASLLESVGLDPCVVRSERTFREFATSGTVDGRAVTPRASALDDERFWQLHEFITHFFDMDAATFEHYEDSRTSR